METLVFRCSQTGSDVQVGVVGPQVSDDTDLYEAVACPACGRLHLVNKGTGKMLGDKGGGHMSYAAQELTATEAPRPSLLSRLGALFRRIISRIDLSHFPKSCCN